MTAVEAAEVFLVCNGAGVY